MMEQRKAISFDVPLETMLAVLIVLMSFNQSTMTTTRIHVNVLVILHAKSINTLKNFFFIPERILNRVQRAT